MALANHSAGRPRLTAATAPASTPRNVASRIASTDSSRVTGRAVRSIEVTLVPVRIEVPRSPCSALLAKCQNCTGSDWSRPYCWRIAASASGVRSSPASASAGSPGRARTPSNTTTVARNNVTRDCHARLIRYRHTPPTYQAAVRRLLGQAGERHPDHTVREDLHALECVRDTGEVALPVDVDDRVRRLDLGHGLPVQVTTLRQGLGLPCLVQDRVQTGVVAARDCLLYTSP